MKDVSALRTKLAEQFARLEIGEIGYKEASEFANLAGKMINSAKIQVEYYAARERRDRIAFIEEPAADEPSSDKA